MSEVLTWSTTAASNNSSPPDGFPEGMLPSTVNNSARENMAAIAKLCDRMGLRFINLGFDAAVAANDLTVSLKTSSAANPASTDPVTILFRNTTVTTGQRTAVDFSAATSVVLPGGGSLGFANSESGKIHIWAVYDGTNKDIGVSRTSNHDESAVHSTTTIGAGSDATNVIYTTTGRTGAAITLIGVISIQYGTAAWTNAATNKTVWLYGTLTDPTFTTLTVGGNAIYGAVLGTSQATTSGTEFDFTIPSSATQITISLVNCSLSGTDDFLVQLGDAGGVETSGYLGSSITTTYTAGFGIRTANASAMVHGSITLTLVNASAFTWAASGSLGRSDSGVDISVGGSKSLSAALTTVRLTRSGTNTFDSGEVNVRYS